MAEVSVELPEVHHELENQTEVQDHNTEEPKNVDKHPLKTDTCYENNSNWFTWPILSFMNKMIRVGAKRPLTAKDLGQPYPGNNPSLLYEKFEERYKLQDSKPKEKRSLFGPICMATGIWNWVWSILLFVITLVLSFIPTLVLQQLVTDLQEAAQGREYLTEGLRWTYTVLLLVIPIINAYLGSIAQMKMVRIGIQMKSMASEAVYRKALYLTSTAKGNTSTGQIVNIMSSDTTMLQMFSLFILVTISAPILLVISLVLIHSIIGWLTWVALGMLCVMLVIQVTASLYARKFRVLNMKYTDERVKLLNEILMGIRIIKYYCWEKPFLGKISEVREKELKQVANTNWLMTVCFDIILQIIPYIIPFVIFAMYPSVMGQPLTPSVIFTSLNLFEALKAPFMMLPMCLLMLIQFNVSIKRINNFLSLDEIDSTLVLRDYHKSSIEYMGRDGHMQSTSDFDPEKDAIVMKDCDFAWGNGDNVLRHINVNIKKGSLVAVVGKVGCGKTSFVSALIGEMTKNSGACMVNGTVSYSSQQAWMVNDTVRGNILFGKPYDEQRYKRAIHVCCMEDDLKILKGGEMCEIGERGINLSGGQKARISLARAVYSDADIIIMDDPIAAVDAHVGKYIFNKCIYKELKGKTRVLVTNAVQYLPKCDHIIVLGDNTIKYQGTYEQLKEQNIDAISLVEGEETRSSTGTSARGTTKKTESKEDNTKEKGDLVEEEEQETGSIPWADYVYYFKNASYILIALILIGYIFGQAFSLYSQFWLSDWSEDPTCITNSTSVACTESTNYYLNGYGIILILVAVFFIIRAVSTVPARLRASKLIHKDLAETIIGAPVAFHDVTPVGRVLNRFNKDIDFVDHQLINSIGQVINFSCILIGSAIQIIITTKGYMAPVLVIVFIIFYFIQLYFRHANTDCQRLESLSRSPIFEDFQAVLSGAPTIRAYGHQQRFIDNIEKKIEDNNHKQTMFQYCSCWLTVRCDVIVGFLSFFIAVLSNLLRGLISPGLLGVALNASSALGATLKQWTKMMAQLEAQMNSIERIKYYIDTVEPEAAMIIPDHRPPEDWPSEGAIKFENYEMRYRNGPKVLKGVNLDIKPQEKIGVVGRTGAGKSSLMVGLFRISEPCGGALYMDNINLSEIGLEDVRKHLCIIPQDPVLFSASVRFNLDPFNESTDEEIWSVLDEVELKEVIDALPKKLDDDVHEGGSNFSVGQRQLICMARALLKKPKVLIMDEATASLDNETDAFLQKMIRKEFKNCTVLTIAHRLNTIMDSSRVCVMDKGVVAEFDTPANLLNNPETIFSGMVKAANDPTLYDAVPGYTGPKPVAAPPKPISPEVQDEEDSPIPPKPLDL